MKTIDKFIAAIVGFSFFMTVYSVYSAFGGDGDPTNISNLLALFFALLAAANYEGSYFYWGLKKEDADGMQFGEAKYAQSVAMWMSLVSTAVGLLMLTEFGNGLREHLPNWVLGGSFIAMMVFSLYTNINGYSKYMDSDPVRVEEVENAEYESELGKQRHAEKMALIQRGRRALHAKVQEHSQRMASEIGSRNFGQVESHVKRIGGKAGEAPERGGGQQPQRPQFQAPAPTHQPRPIVPSQQFSADKPEPRGPLHKTESYDPSSDITNLVTEEDTPKPQAAQRGPQPHQRK